MREILLACVAATAVRVAPARKAHAAEIAIRFRHELEEARKRD